jgi:hypothetical protein
MLKEMRGNLSVQWVIKSGVFHDTVSSNQLVQTFAVLVIEGGVEVLNDIWQWCTSAVRVRQMHLALSLHVLDFLGKIQASVWSPGVWEAGDDEDLQVGAWNRMIGRILMSR